MIILFIFFGNVNIHSFSQSYIIPPKSIDNLIDIKYIACGERHIICLNMNGEVFSFGNNNGGILGLRKSVEILYTSAPQKINLPCKE